MIEELSMIYDDFKDANQKSLSHLENELIKIRAGKASPAMLNSVMVEYYGAMTPLQQVANVNTMDQNNGEQLIIAVPPLTEERRRDLVKRAKSEAENAKIGIRNNRKDAIDMIKDLKTEGLSEDLSKDAEEEVQKITNAYIKKVDELLELKEKDIMTI